MKIVQSYSAFDTKLPSIPLQLWGLEIYDLTLIRGRICEQRQYHCPTCRAPRSLEKP